MIGKTLQHYEIVEQIGKGGMGEVFRARDTKLDRDVAIKILPADLSGDTEREARFQREARALASLQHPNVASIYGFEEDQGTRFLVMELIKGAELTSRMGAGPVAVADAVNIARQLAAGLEAAHDKGIVHRDLKPANIMETTSGEVKILDFGLAQAWFGDNAGTIDSTSAPTLTAAMTQVGVVLGTAAYMSPEQARGAYVDRRTDIWAFGVIMFEMLTGKPLFQGETNSDTLAAVLRATPDWDLLPVAEAPDLCRLIERCLERNPKQRLRDIGEARIFLQSGGVSGSSLNFSLMGTSGPTESVPARRTPILLIAAVALACLAGGAMLGWKILARPRPVPILHTMLPPPTGTDYDLKSTAPGPAVISPDGTMVAFTGVDDGGKTQLYLRHLDQGESVSLSGTDNANYPFWSPDSRFIGFFDEPGKKLKKVAVGGGPPVTLCASENGKGGSWNTAGVIIFAPSYDSGIAKVAAIGGEPTLLTKITGEFDSHRHPRFLPDGREFIYIARSTSSSAGNAVFVASLDTSVVPRIIAESAVNAEYADGYLMTVRENVLMATPFKPDQIKVTEGGTPLVENILTIPGAAVGVFSPSATGMLVYQTGASTPSGRQLFWTSVDNASLVALGEPGQLDNPRISPDGTRAVVEVQGASNEGTDLWLVDLVSGLRTRFTFAPGDEIRAVWAPDGGSIYYQSRDKSLNRILQQPVDGLGATTILASSNRDIAPTSVSSIDGSLLLDYLREDGKIDMRRLARGAADSTMQTVASIPDNNLGGGIYSPDGRWISYHAVSAAGWDVFVMPAVGGLRKWQVTNDGAVYPHWNTEGNRLWVSMFNGDLRIYEVDGSGQTFKIGPFTVAMRITSPDADGEHYDLDPEGGRILQASADPSFRAEMSYLQLVTDWKRGLIH